MPTGDTDSIFVNCPFDVEYKSFFNAIVFAIYKCKFLPRCALEVDDASEVRLTKIVRIIKDCRFAIHDISRTELSTHGLPRFNMPLELGLFMGAKYFGDKINRRKSCLVFDREQYRYQRFISDIAGQDITSHDGDEHKAIVKLRDWLSSMRRGIPSGTLIREEYEKFQAELPEICHELHLLPAELTYSDYIRVVYEWLEERET